MGSEQPENGRSSDDRQQSGSSGGGPDVTEPQTDASDLSLTDGQSERVPGVDSPISVDELFELLSQPGNRYTLAYLVRADGAVPYDDLVEYVVDEGGTPDGLSTRDFRNSVATRLVHSNLPKLDDAGLLNYDSEQKTVRPTDATSVAVPYLELAMCQFSSE